MQNDDEGKHIYAIRYPKEIKDLFVSEQATATTPTFGQEQCPPRKKMHAPMKSKATISQEVPKIEGDTFGRTILQQNPAQPVVDWVTVSEEHNIFIADVGLLAEDCDQIVVATEQVCRGQYAAYTYAKQTLGCREHPPLAEACFPPVHTVVHAIGENFSGSRRLQLDDREPHIVKYDTTKKERQKLDMHTDKSEWTFLIALSNGCGVDYEGGGTYFECIDTVIHLQRGHALIFPGNLRHCGKKIVGGLRFLLVGFLVDKLTKKHKSVRASVDDDGEDYDTSGSVYDDGEDYDTNDSVDDDVEDYDTSGSVDDDVEDYDTSGSVYDDVEDYDTNDSVDDDVEDCDISGSVYDEVEDYDTNYSVDDDVEDHDTNDSVDDEVKDHDTNEDMDVEDHDTNEDMDIEDYDLNEDMYIEVSDSNEDIDAEDSDTPDEDMYGKPEKALRSSNVKAS